MELKYRVRSTAQYSLYLVDTKDPFWNNTKNNEITRIDQTLSIWLGIQFRQRHSQIKDWMPNIFFIFFAWHDPDTQGVQELILSLFKVHSWLTYGWRSVLFWWYFHTFHENGDGVLLKIRLKAPTKTILEAVLFMYLLTNTNNARI